MDGVTHRVIQVTERLPEAAGTTKTKLYVGPIGIVERAVQETSDADGQRFLVDTRLLGVVTDRGLIPSDFAFGPPTGFREERRSADDRNLLPRGRAAPNFTLPLAGGGMTSLQALLAGRKALLLSFWFRNCGACRIELPEIQRLQRELKGMGLAVMTVNTVDSSGGVNRYPKASSLRSPVGLLANKEHSKMLSGYGVLACPTTYIVDASGKVAYGAVGYDDAGVRSALALLGVK